MIWISSFPRSGNTFFRNILYEVYGLESSTFHVDSDYHHDENYQDYPFIKTHLLPHQLEPDDSKIPAIYIVRDGRDALCSIAHHRKDIVVPGSDYYENLKAAIIAEKGTFFGGWSGNVKEWIERAELIIRYEDLVTDPVGCAERLRKIYNLPKSRPEKMPTFEEFKFGLPKYGSGKDRDISEEEMHELARKNFRKGKVGSWKEEMPEELFELFWSYHGETMEHLGYSKEGEIIKLNPDLDYQVMHKLGIPYFPEPAKRKKILIEANKLVSGDNDGIKRYQVELLKGLLPVIKNPDRQWDIDLYIQGKIQPLTANKKLLYNDFNTEDTIIKDKQGIKVKKSLFQRFEGTLVNIIPDNFIAYLNKHNIRIFHKVYDIIKQTLFKVAELIVKAVRFIINLLYLIKTWLKHLFTDPKTEKQFRTYDLIHLPLMQHYLPFRRTKSRILVTIHDLTHRYYPQFHTSINISNAEKGLRFITRSEADVIAVSDSTFRDTLKECRINKEKVHLVYEAAEKDKFRFILNRDETGKVKKKYGIPPDGPFFLCLSTIEPRKNLTNTIRAFTKLIEENPDYNVNLVIAGKKGWSFDKLYLHNKVLSKRIVFTGFVNDKDLSALYSEALALCYVSYYEGFGLPILEAMNCMSPVIYGNNSSMPEIVGDGGIPADPDNIDDIKQKMKQIFEDHDLREQLRKMALKKSLNFSWRNTIIDTLKVYDQIINRS